MNNTDFQESYNDWCEFTKRCMGVYIEEFTNIPEQDKKFAWISSFIFQVETDDIWLDVEFGEVIYDVMVSIYERKTYQYIKQDKDWYKKFIIVYNLLDDFDLVQSGGSIRGSWFDYFDNQLDLSEENMRYLLFKFMKKE